MAPGFLECRHTCPRVSGVPVPSGPQPSQPEAWMKAGSLKTQPPRDILQYRFEERADTKSSTTLRVQHGCLRCACSTSCSDLGPVRVLLARCRSCLALDRAPVSSCSRVRMLPAQNGHGLMRAFFMAHYTCDAPSLWPYGVWTFAKSRDVPSVSSFPS